MKMGMKEEEDGKEGAVRMRKEEEDGEEGGEDEGGSVMSMGA